MSRPDPSFMLETLVAELGTLKTTPGLMEKAAPGLTRKAFDAAVSRLDMSRGWKLGGGLQIGIAFHIIVDLIVLYFILIWSGKKQAP